jgi:hypothetical protein
MRVSAPDGAIECNRRPSFTIAGVAGDRKVADGGEALWRMKEWAGGLR